MLFDEETKHWQGEHEKDNLDDEYVSGEIRALLDGSAQKKFVRKLKILGVVVVGVLTYLAVYGT